MAFLTAVWGAVTLASPQASDLGRFEVLADSRKDRFAGKLGYRIDETLTVSKEGRRYFVKLPKVRTREPSRLPKWPPGRTVAVRGRVRGSTIWAERKDVRILSEVPARTIQPNREDQ